MLTGHHTDERCVAQATSQQRVELGRLARRRRLERSDLWPLDDSALDGWHVEEAARRPIALEQRFDGALKRRVAFAGATQERRPLVLRPVEGGMEECLHARPLVVRLAV